MPLREHLQNYLDTEQPENILLFRVSMVLSLAACMFMALLSVLLRMERIVPVMISGGVLITLAAMEGQRHVRRLEWVSGGYLFMMFFLLLPAMSFRVAYAIYDFPVYFLTGIVFITVLFQKRWAAAIVAAVSCVDLFCIYRMMEKIGRTADQIDTAYNIILLIRIIAALFIMGTVCGVQIAYRSRVLRREIDKSIDMEKQAEQFSFAKNMFLVNVSHEIRTPLNAIQGITEILMEQDADEHIKDSAFQMAKSGRALLSITNELMDFSKLDDTELQPVGKPYFIGDIFDELINMIAVRFADYNTEFFTDIDAGIPEQLVGDAGMVRQIMMSVVSGVMKSVGSGAVRLRIRCSSDEAQVDLAVEVTAEGTFRHSYREWLYQSHGMADETDEVWPPLPQRLVELMGGTMRIDEGDEKRTYHFHIVQGYESDKPLVDKTAYGGFRVLFYENTVMQGSVFAGALHELGVPFCQASGDEFFLSECVKPEYTHILVAEERYDGVCDRLAALLRPQSVVLIGTGMMSYDDALIRCTFARPVNCLNLDALLRGRQSSTIHHVDYNGRFICPDVHIMVVDDNIINLEVAASVLSRYQARVTLAASGKECLKLLQEDPADFILLDYMMPEMDGIDTLKNIRAMDDPRMQTVPVAALTANAVSGARAMFLSAGFSEYISKPIERDKLEKVLKSCLPQEKIVYVAEGGEQPDHRVVCFG